MRVYRLEMPDGRGPYRIRRPSATLSGYPVSEPLAPKFASYLKIEQAWALDTYDPNEEDPHPAPFEDGLASTRWAWSALDVEEYCGFESEAAMRAWFLREPHDPQALHDMGLTVTIWEAPAESVRKGNKQLVFVRDESTLISRHSPLEYAV